MAITTMNCAERGSVLELADFPDEIVLKVFASLDSKDLLNCGQVSKRFRRISHDELLWQRIDLRGKIVSAAFIQFILDKGCKHLDLSNSQDTSHDIKSIQHIFKNCVQLKELNLESTDISIKEFVLFFESLTPQWKKINIGILYKEDPDEHIEILVERCNQGKEHLKYYAPITNSALTSIIEELKNARYLNTFDLNLHSPENINCIQIKLLYFVN